MKSKEEILAKRELPKVTVNVPDWGGDVTVTTLTAIDRDRMEQGWKHLGREDGDYAGFRAWVVAHTIQNGDGHRFFDPQNDLDGLNQQPADLIGRLFDKACKLNALTKSDQDELVKNSETSRNGGSSSGSV